MVVFSKGTEGCLDNLRKDFDLDTSKHRLLFVKMFDGNKDTHTFVHKPQQPHYLWSSV